MASGGRRPEHRGPPELVRAGRAGPCGQTGPGPGSHPTPPLSILLLQFYDETEARKYTQKYGGRWDRGLGRGVCVCRSASAHLPPFAPQLPRGRDPGADGGAGRGAAGAARGTAVPPPGRGVSGARCAAGVGAGPSREGTVSRRCPLPVCSCGSGLSGEHISEEGHCWIGVDISRAMLGERPSTPLCRECRGRALSAALPAQMWLWRGRSKEICSSRIWAMAFPSGLARLMAASGESEHLNEPSAVCTVCSSCEREHCDSPRSAGTCSAVGCLTVFVAVNQQDIWTK